MEEKPLYHYDEVNEIWYKLKGKYYYECEPDELPEKAKRQPKKEKVEPDYHIGKFGQARYYYLKENHPDTYRELKKNGTMRRYLIDFEKMCFDQKYFLVKEMAKREGVDEKLKMADPMKWVRRMNNISSCAEEVIMAEYVSV